MSAVEARRDLEHYNQIKLLLLNWHLVGLGAKSWVWRRGGDGGREGRMWADVAVGAGDAEQRLGNGATMILWIYQSFHTMVCFVLTSMLPCTEDQLES